MANAFLGGGVSADDPSDIVLDEFSLSLGNGAQVKNLGVTDIEAVTSITDDAWETDLPAEYISLGWYNYGENHILTAKDYVYVVNTPDGKYPAFEITNYYDNEGESGTYTINWKYLD